ncbi:MAG: EamA family transporter [Acetobacteraceae bacterium]|nr:EamA family transporter [Acetobacteraceae bacterium]
MAAGTAAMAPFCPPQVLLQEWARVPGWSWMKLAYAAVPAGGPAYPLWYQAVGSLGPTRLTAFTYLVPAVAVVLAAAFLRESPGWMSWRVPRWCWPASD